MLGMSMPLTKRRDTLGEQLSLAVAFRESGFDPTMRCEDSVRSEVVPASEVFRRDNDRWHMVADSLPGHIGIKSITVDEKALYLETSPLDQKKTRVAIEEAPLWLMVRATELLFRDKTRTRGIRIRIGKEFDPEISGLGKRCLWTIPHSPLHMDVCIDVADAIYTADCYVVEEIEQDFGPATSVAAVQSITQKVQLGFQQRLVAEQRPILAGQQKGILAARQAVGALIHDTRRMVGLSGDELAVFLESHARAFGLLAAYELSVFALAGKLKGVRSDLEWPQARQLAKKLIG